MASRAMASIRAANSLVVSASSIEGKSVTAGLLEGEPGQVGEGRIGSGRFVTDRLQVGHVDFGDALSDGSQQRLPGAVVVRGRAVWHPGAAVDPTMGQPARTLLGQDPDRGVAQGAPAFVTVASSWCGDVHDCIDGPSRSLTPALRS